MTERRTLCIHELRADPKARQIAGIAASYGVLSADLGGFRERIDPGAFTRTLSEKSNILAYYNHDSSYVLGSTRSGSLHLSSDSRGLNFRVDLPDTSYARDLITLMERNDVSQMSFGFVTKRQSWDEPAPGEALRIRTLLDVDLMEISVVADPAYPQGTEAALRSLTDHRARQAVERSRRLFSFATRRA